MTLPAEDPSIARITARLGRPLRVLHIGNIANNAYNNAKIQRQYGIDADVICYDYYHVMATPEWEDGGLTTRLDPNLPNWWASNLKGFKRPEWYVQGPLALCLEYLDAHRRQQKPRRWNAAASIENAYVAQLKQDAILHKLPWVDPRPFLRRHAALRPISDGIHGQRGLALATGLASGLKTAFKRLIMSGLGKVLDSPRRLSTLPNQVRQLIVWPLLAAAIAEPPRIHGSALIIRAYGLMRRGLGRDARDNVSLMRQAAILVPEDTSMSWATCMKRLGALLIEASWQMLHLPSYLPAKRLSKNIWPTEPVAPLEEREQIAAAIIDGMVPARRWDDLPADCRRELETQIVHHALLFAPVLKHYDVIQGYSIDGFIPLVNGAPAFASYEHGTLRELPFENSLTGLICNIAYRHSPAVFVTNTDVLPSVERLGLEPSYVHCLPHAFDERKLIDWRDAHLDLNAPSDQVVFFCPARQHWKEGESSWRKGNDLIIKAAAKLYTAGHRFRLVFVNWGKELEISKNLIEEVGISECVEWVEPMGKLQLWQRYCTSHAVVDQFVMPALGGVGFEAMALGRVLITRFDEAQTARFFGARPPALQASDVDQLAAAMLRVIKDPKDIGGLGVKAKEWISKYHSAKRIVEIQAAVYEKILSRS